MDLDSNLGFPVWDAHFHNWNDFAHVTALRTHLDRHRIQHVNLLGPLHGGYTPTPGNIESSNAHTQAFRDALPDRVAAYCYLNPEHEAQAVAEWQRCRAAGFVGIKLWVALKCDDPRYLRVIEKIAADRCPILIHTWDKAEGQNLPGESTAQDFARMARLFPETRFIMAHIGGRYERSIAAIRDLANVTVDYAGSPNELGAYETALAELGPDRILFGTDVHDYLACAERVLEATPDPVIRRKIFFHNMAALTPQAFRQPSLTPPLAS